MTHVITLRFVSCRTPLSEAIRFVTNFWASHVEAVMPDGSGYLGALDDGHGVQVRPVGYDQATLGRQYLATLPTTPAVQDAFYAALAEHIGEPYDWGAIAGFVFRQGWHQPKHVICSALQTMCLGTAKYFPGPLAVRSSETSPRDLAMMVSAVTPLLGIAEDD